MKMRYSLHDEAILKLASCPYHPPPRSVAPSFALPEATASRRSGGGGGSGAGGRKVANQPGAPLRYRRAADRSLAEQFDPGDLHLHAKPTV